MKNILFLLSILALSCNVANDKKDDFLQKFRTIKEFPTGEYFNKNNVIKVNDTISKDILSRIFLIPVNDNFSVKHILKKYYYSGKYDLNKNHTIIVYRLFYDYHESKTVINIYDKINRRVTSCLEIMSSDLSLKRSSYYKDGIIYVDNTYEEIPNGLDPSQSQKNMIKEELEKYKINEDFIFVKIN